VPILRSRIVGDEECMARLIEVMEASGLAERFEAAEKRTAGRVHVVAKR
jgi:hypothetical protein